MEEKMKRKLKLTTTCTKKLDNDCKEDKITGRV